MDDNGFKDVPITTVWTMGALENEPFSSKVLPFWEGAHKTWKDRWVWTFNPYPIWSDGFHPSSAGDCKAKTEQATSLETTKQFVNRCRKGVTAVTGDKDSKLWIGEVGWSSPCAEAGGMERICGICPDWASSETLMRYYENMLTWDLTLDEGGPVDHLFYFPMRDSRSEAFGMVGDCET